MRQIVIAAKIQYSIDGAVTTLGASSTAYFASASGLLNRTWYPILDSSVGVSVDVSLPWESGSPSQEIGDVLLANGGDGEYQHVLDLLVPAQLAGLVTEVKRGYVDQSWEELPDLIFRARNAGKRFDGESLIIPQRPFLDRLEKPLATQVFGDDTPNPRIVNRTLPLQIGQAFQIDPLIWDAPNQVYYVASNVSNVSAVREGGARTDNFVETDFGFQLLAGSNLQITADAIGPEPAAGVSQSAVVDWDFIAWTSGQPDGIDTTENPPEASITESAAGDEADIDVLATPTADTGWMSIQNPIEPLFAGVPGNDAWTANGAGTVEAAVVTDDGSFAEATIFGVTPLRVGSYLPALPDGNEVTGVEIELIAEGTNIEIVLLTANQRDPGTRVAAFVDANGEVSGSGIAPNSITSTKQALTGGGPNFVGGGVGVREVVTSEDVNDPGMHFSLKVQPATAGSATIKIYQVRVKVHHRPSIDIVRLFSPTSVLEPGERHTVTVELVSADIYARWGGSSSSGGALKDSTDPFSTSLTRLEGAGRASFEFVPDPGEAFFGIEFKRLNSAGTATINRIKVEKRADGLNRYKTLVPYMAELVGLDSSDTDQAMIDAHDAATGSPEMGWRIEANESMAEVMDLFARSLSGVWWPDRDGKLRSVLWTLDPDSTPDVIISNITVDGKPQRTRIQGNATLESDLAPNATERAVGARNWRPLQVSETAGITEEFSEQERANVIEDWRVRRRANFDNLNPWPAATPVLSLTSISPTTGDPAGGTSVTITGENFDIGSAATVTFGGVSATNIVVVSATEITCTTPAGTAGTVDVVVTQGSESDTLAAAFEYTAAGAWTPADINTAFWIKFSDSASLTLSGAEITQVDTKSNLNMSRNLTNSGVVNLVADATIGADAAEFTGGAERLVSNFSNGSGWTDGDYYHIVVVRPDAGGNSGTAWLNPAVIGDNSSGWNNLMIRDTGVDVDAQFYHWDGSVEFALDSIVLGDWVILSQENSGGFIRGRVDAGTEVTDAAGNQSGGATLDLGSAGFAGRIAEYIRLDSAPTESDRQKIEGYLAHEYGLEANLPSSHPYKISPP